MLAHSDTEIEQTLRNARLLFEKLAKVLDSTTEATENYRISIEQLVAAYKAREDLTAFKRNVEHQYAELSKLL
jgi:hypothetical protein